MAIVSKVLGKVPGIAMTGLMLKGSIDEYEEYRQEGDSKLVSLAKAAGSFAFFSMLGPWGIPYMGAQIAYGLGKAGGQAKMQAMEHAYNNRGYLGSGQINLNEKGYTMRQRSLNAIRSNGLNLQSVLGNEARQYFGRYD